MTQHISSMLFNYYFASFRKLRCDNKATTIEMKTNWIIKKKKM